MINSTADVEKYKVTRNACKLCTPLGACLAFMGMEKSITLLHGSQGCSTYIRRYLISHFREPIDIASTNFTEESAVFGGGDNLKKSLTNLISQYSPGIIGVATTCLSETIGDDVPKFLREYRKDNPDAPELVHVSTPSYTGTHAEGFHRAVLAMVSHFAKAQHTDNAVNIFCGMISPADIRHIRSIVESFGLRPLIVPDYSERLDGAMWEQFHLISEGGTTREELEMTGGALASIEFGHSFSERESAGSYLESSFGVRNHRMPFPTGIKGSDAFISLLELISGKKAPAFFCSQRGRLVDSYADGHKYIAGKKVIICGDEDMVVPLAAMCNETGLIVSACATGAKSRVFARALQQLEVQPEEVMTGADYIEIEQLAGRYDADLMIGSSKAFKAARSLNVPLMRMGFPIHDRFGGQRLLSAGYEGTQRTFDSMVNHIIEKRQANNPAGYFYY